MPRRSAVIGLFGVLVSFVSSCSGGSVSAQPTPSLTPTTSATSLVTACNPASPMNSWRSSTTQQVEGTGQGATLWGLLMFPHGVPARVGDQEKIVWRMTGTGRLTLEAIDPDGRSHQPAWGPDAHSGSSWTKPGDEWGAGYVFTEPGCWDLRAVRGEATADVYLRVTAD